MVTTARVREGSCRSELHGAILLSRGHCAVPVALDKPERDLLLSYAYNGMFNIRHALLLRLQFKSSATTVHGHSGSALASSSSGGRLLGMHLYLDDSSNTALAIPAALVFDPRRYMGGGPSEQRSLLTRASHELMPYFATPATTAAPASAVQSLPTTLPHAVVPFWVEALLDQHAMYDGITWLVLMPFNWFGPLNCWNCEKLK